VAPYKVHGEERPNKLWHSTLDCASGAVWNASAIAQVTEVKPGTGNNFSVTKEQFSKWSYIDSRMLRYFALGGDSNPQAYDLSKAGFYKPVVIAIEDLIQFIITSKNIAEIMRKKQEITPPTLLSTGCAEPESGRRAKGTTDKWIF